MTKLKFLGFLLFLLFCLNSFSQEITNVRVTQEGKTVVVMYDLSGDANPYNVKLFYTLDDGKTWLGPLKNVTGDVISQKPAKDKKIIWNAIAEKGQFEGDIQFRLFSEINGSYDQTINNPTEAAIIKPTYSPEYYKYKKSKTLWLCGALVSGATGAFSYMQANKYYDQYLTATTDAASLHQKVEQFDQIAPIALGVAGLCAFEFILKAGKQSKAKKQSLSFLPLPLKNGAGIGLAYTF